MVYDIFLQDGYDAKREEAHNALAQLFATHNGTLSADQIIQTAAQESHVLHAVFTWDDAEAAAQWRCFKSDGEARKGLCPIYGVVLPESHLHGDLDYNIPAGLEVDHIDGDTLNDRIENLQLLIPMRPFSDYWFYNWRRKDTVTVDDSTCAAAWRRLQAEELVDGFNEDPNIVVYNIVVFDGSQSRAQDRYKVNYHQWKVHPRGYFDLGDGLDEDYPTLEQLREMFDYQDGQLIWKKSVDSEE